jgi:hypothetical protein
MRSLSRTVSAMAPATSIAVAAAAATISVSGAVATARTASTANPNDLDRAIVPEHLIQEDELGEEEQCGPAEREDRESERRVVSGVGDGHFVGDGDRNQPQDDQRQGPRAPPPDGARTLGGLGRLGADLLVALEVAPPQRDSSGEADHQCEQALEFERLVRERVAHRQHGLAEQDDAEQSEALDEVAARDLGVSEAAAVASAGQPVLRPAAA